MINYSSHSRTVASLSCRMKKLVAVASSRAHTVVSTCWFKEDVISTECSCVVLSACVLVYVLVGRGVCV